MAPPVPPGKGRICSSRQGQGRHTGGEEGHLLLQVSGSAARVSGSRHQLSDFSSCCSAAALTTHFHRGTAARALCCARAPRSPHSPAVKLRLAHASITLTSQTSCSKYFNRYILDFHVPDLLLQILQEISVYESCAFLTNVLTITETIGIVISILI